jgi:hypothetical protein
MALWKLIYLLGCCKRVLVLWTLHNSLSALGKQFIILVYGSIILNTFMIVWYLVNIVWRHSWKTTSLGSTLQPVLPATASARQLRVSAQCIRNFLMQSHILICARRPYMDQILRPAIDLSDCPGHSVTYAGHETSRSDYFQHKCKSCWRQGTNNELQYAHFKFMYSLLLFCWM